MNKRVDKVNQMAQSRQEQHANQSHQADSDIADEVFEIMHTIVHLYRARQYHELRDGPHDITHMEARVLGFFARYPRATLSDLVAYSGRDKAQLTRLIHGLRDKGLLDAQTDAADRRSIRLHLTTDGKAVYKRLHQRGSRLSKVAVADLSQQEYSSLVSLLQRVRSNLEDETE
jgi:DNA-binding MarR family transcriptional regulator